MSSEIEFECNFCDKIIKSGSINTDFMGYCRKESIPFPVYIWTNDLESNIHGPHICDKCITDIINARETILDTYTG